MRILIGTYTDGSESKGLYLFSFSPETGESRLLDTLPLGNPSFVVPSPDGSLVYAVSEYDDTRAQLCTLDLADDRLCELSRLSTGSGPCNILLVPPFIITSDFAAGSLTAHRLDSGDVHPASKDLPMAAPVWCFTPPADPRPSRMHAVVLSPDGKYLFATDLGNDTLWRFTPESDDPFAHAQVAWSFDQSQHPGPRQMVFSADGRFLYLLHEKSDELSVFSYRSGELTLLHTFLAYEGAGHGSSGICLHPNGRFLYTSHRLRNDGISIFELSSSSSPLTGRMGRVFFLPTGRHPRHFSISPDGRFLLCACRDADRVECYAIDPDTGLLSSMRCSISVPKPACVQIIE